MKYYKFVCDTPYAGTTSEEVYEFGDSVSIDELDELSEDLKRNNAESYEYLVFGFDYNPIEEEGLSEEEYEEIIEDYYQDCSCYYEEISKEEYNNF